MDHSQTQTRLQLQVQETLWNTAETIPVWCHRFYLLKTTGIILLAPSAVEAKKKKMLE